MKEEAKTKRQLIKELLESRRQIAQLEKAEDKSRRAREVLQKREKETKRLAKENEIMAEIGRIISSTLHIEEIYERFIQEVRKLLPADRITIAIGNPQTETLTVAYAWGLEMAERKAGDVISLAGTTSKEVMRTRSSMLIREENLERIAKKYPGVVPYIKAGFRSMIAIPLVSKDRVVGVMHLRSLKPNAYTPIEVNLAERVGNQIAGAIANALLFLERERAEEALKNSEKKYREVVENTTDIIHITDVRGNFTFANSAALNLTGYSLKEFLQINHLDLIVPEHRERIREIAGRQFRDRQPTINTEFPCLTKSGKVIWLNQNTSLIMEGDKVSGFHSMARDITERKRVEEELKESEEKYRNLFEQSKDAVYISTKKGKFLDVNQATLDLFGYSREEMLTVDIRKLYANPEDRPRFQREIEEKGNLKDYELKFRRKDGKEIDCLLTATVRYDKNGVVLGYQGIIRDITEHKQIEEGWHKSEEEAKRLARENAVMAEIGRVVTSTPGLEEVFENFAAEVNKIISFDAVTIAVVDQKDNTVHFRYRMGIDVPGRGQGDIIPLEAGTIAAEIIRRRSSLIIQGKSPREVADQFPGLLPFIQAGLQSFLTVPLILRDQVIGLLGFSSKKPVAYGAEDVNLAERVGNQITGAVANAQLFAERKKAEDDLRRSDRENRQLAKQHEIMAEIGKIISSTLNIEEVYERFAEAARKIISFDRISVNLIDHAQGIVNVAYTTGVPVPGRQPGDSFLLNGSVNQEVAQKRAGLIIQPKDEEDLASLHLTRQRSFRAGLKSQMSVPLISEDRAIGILTFFSLQPNAYSSLDLRLGESIGSQIAGTIANAQLYLERFWAEEAARKSEEEAKRLAKENAVMAEIGRIIGSTLNIEEVYEPFAKEVGKIISFDGIVVGIINYANNTLLVPYISGLDVPSRQEGEIMPLAGSATAEIIRTHSSLLIQGKGPEDIAKEIEGLRPYVQVGIQSFLIVPLLSGDKVIGILGFISKRPNAYSIRDQNLAERVGNQIAGAVANAQLFAERKQIMEALRKSEEEAKRLAQENALVAEIGRIIGVTPNIDEVFERFSKAVAKLIPFDRVMVNLNSPQQDASFVRYVAGVDIPKRRAGEYVPLAGTATAECMRTKSSLLIQPQDVGEIEEVISRFPGLGPSFEAGIRSIIMVPLIAEDQIIGILSLRSVKEKVYTKEDVRLTESIASQIAGAVANAQLYIKRKQAEEAARRNEEEARRVAQENEIMAEIGRIISSTLNINEVYERFAEEMRKLIPFDRVALNIIDLKNYTFSIPYVSGPQVTGRRTGEVISLACTGTEEIMRTRASILIHEGNKEAVISRCPGLLPIMEAGFQSIMMVPLISENEVMGVLNIQSTQRGAYTEEDLRLAERISSQIAGAITNAQLFAEGKKSEQALRESEELYRSILESIEDGYYEVDLKGNFTFFNDSLCRILGYSREEMMGMNNRQYTDQENARKLFQTFNKVFRTGQPAKEFDWEIIRKDGTKRNIDASVSLIRDAENNPRGFRGIVRDITERKQSEKEMAELQDQLRQSQKIEAIGQLAGGIAHDFNNSLTLIRTCSQLALYNLKAGDPLKETFEMIEKATEKSANLTRQLLAFSRRQVMEPKVVDLNILIQEMDKMLHRLIGEDIELQSVLAENLGRVKVDPGQMEQVIVNMAINARDAMPQGGKLTIETANVFLDEAYANNHVSVKPGRYVRLSMSDTGIGMTPEVKTRIFEPFFTTKEKGKGTGLGLSTVYGIVKQSGGNIWVYSELGKGTTFKIYLPRVDELLEEEKEKVRWSEEELPQGRETVLVVEDDQDVRSLVVQILKKQGYKVLEASNGGEAFMILEKDKGRIDLLMTDVVMPGLSGREVADRLLLLHPEMKVLFMSGYTDDAIVRYGVLEAGANFIQKPFSVEAVARKVREVLDK